MPELAAPSSDSSVTPSSPYKKGRGLLSVRFQGDNEAFEADEGQYTYILTSIAVGGLTVDDLSGICCTC